MRQRQQHGASPNAMHTVQSGGVQYARSTELQSVGALVADVAVTDHWSYRPKCGIAVRGRVCSYTAGHRGRCEGDIRLNREKRTTNR